LKLRQPLFKAKQPRIKLIQGSLSECLFRHLSAPDAELGKAALDVIAASFYDSSA
jgi:hypothetical protein